MKKFESVLVCCALSVFVSSCGIFNIKNHYYGVTSAVPEEELSIVMYDSALSVYKVNGGIVNWDMTVGEKEIYLQSGEYTFTVEYGKETYSNGYRVWMSTKPIDIGPFSLEKGKKYYIVAISNYSKIGFNLVDEETYLANKASFLLPLY